MRKCASLMAALCFFVIAKETKVGIVDSDRIFQEYQATAAARVEFTEYVKTYRDSTVILKQNIEDLKAELEAQKLVLSEEARLRKLDEIESLNEAYDQYLQDIFGTNGKVEQKNKELMGPLLVKVNDAVAKIADQEGFTVVLDLSESVFYANSELDITDLVIDELNLEYGPEIITGNIKKRIAIIPFREENSDAINTELGQRCQDELYNAISPFAQKYEVVKKNEVKGEIVRQNFGRNLDDNQAYTIALKLLCDYIIVGKVSKFATRIDYTITLKDVDQRLEIHTKNNSVTDDIKLAESLNNDLREILQKIE